MLIAFQDFGLFIRYSLKFKIDAWASPNDFVPTEMSVSPAPNSTIRYDGSNGRITAIVLKDNSILEVKRDGQSKKAHYSSYTDWLATLPEDAEAACKVETARVGTATAPTDDIGWMRAAIKTVGKRAHIAHRYFSLNDLCAYYKKRMDSYEDNTSLNEVYTSSYTSVKAHVDRMGGPESEMANHRTLCFTGGQPFWILSKDGGKPEPLYFGPLYIWDRVTSTHTTSELRFFYQDKQGTTFAEVGIPVDAETGWPNLWYIYNNQFKPLAKPVV